MNKIIIIIICMLNANLSSYSADESLDLGLRFQKSVGLYYENGFTFQYSNADYLHSEDIEIGFSYFSSRLGSAMGSNAISQDNYLLNMTYYYLPFYVFEPLAKLNIGYFYADYESEIFDDLDNSSMMLSLELGTKINTKSPLNFNISMGYNLITGDGLSGAGTLYPVFYQLGITWDLFYKETK